MKWWKFILLFWISQVQAVAIIDTVAGDGIQQFGGDGGSATTASLNTPYGIAKDTAGTLYIADTNNHRIRTIKDGYITTIAGNGTSGYRDGQQALLNHPTGITLDGISNIYFADTNNHVIRLIDKQHNVTTIVGNSVQGYSGDNGPAILAQLNNPTAITFDSVGNLYIADTNNHRIRKVANGYITTLIGNGIVGMTIDQLNSPQGLAVNNYNLYIADTNNHRILQIDNTGSINLFAGNSTLGIGGDNGPAILAQLNFPRGLAIAHDLYIADSGNHRIRKVTNGYINTIAGNNSSGFTGDRSLAKLATLNNPTAITIDSSNNLYLTDTNNHRIRSITTHQRNTRDGQILTINKPTLGIITAEGLNCGDTCTASYTDNVTLTASPYNEAAFNNWTGDCTGNSPTITIIMDANKNCTANFLPFTNNKSQPSSIATSPDGKHIYATNFIDNSISTYIRNTGGSISFINSLTDIDIDSGLAGASAVIVSPNGRHVYVGSSQHLTTFTRNNTNGNLTLVEVKQNGIDGNQGLAGISAIAFSPDETRVYIIGQQDNSLSVYARDLNTGLLNFLAIQQQGITAPTDVVVNGNIIYVSNSDAITAFTRNPALGEIAIVATYPEEINEITGLAITANHLYAINNNSITAYNQNAGIIGAIQTNTDNENNIEGLDSASDIIISPDGKRVFVTSFNDDAVAIFDRSVDTGLLTFQKAVTRFDGAKSITIEPTGNFAYIATNEGIETLSTGLAEIQISITSPKSVAVNSDLNYVISVSNNGSDTATNVTLTENLPANITLTNSTSSQGVCGLDGGKVKCALGTLAVNSVATVNLQVATPATVTAPVLLNEVSVIANETDIDVTNNIATTNTKFMLEVPQSDLQLAVVTTPESIVGPNNQLVYELTVSNAGPENADNIIITSTLPDNVIFDGDTSDCSAVDKIVTCNLSQLETNASKQFSIHTTTGETLGPIEFTSNVISNASDQNTSNNQVTWTNELGIQELDLMVLDAIATPVTTWLNVGSDITYTVQVQNNSTDTIATGVRLTANLPPQMTYIKKTESCEFIGSQISCPMENINPTDSQNISLTLRAIQTGVNVVTSFTVTGDGTDTDPNNNTGSTSLERTIGSVADFVVTVKGNADSVLVGENVSYEIGVTNNGPDIANAVLQVSIAGDNAAVAVSAENCSTGTNFSCSFILMPVGETQSITVDVTPTIIGNIVVTAEVIGNSFDSSQPNKASTETAVANLLADIGVELAAEPILSFLTKNTTYITTITNHGPSQATGIVVTQDLDPNVKFISATPSQGPNCTFANHAVTCKIGPLGSGSDNKAFVNTIVVPQLLGTVNSAVTVKSDMVDSNLANNTAQIEKKITQMVAQLEMTGEAFPNPVVVKNPLTYTLQVTNTGPYAATDIKIKADITSFGNLSGLEVRGLEAIIIKSPATITPFEVNGTCEDINESGQINCSIESLPKDGTATITIEILPKTNGLLTFTSEATATESETITTTIETQISRPTALFYLNQQLNEIAGVSNLQGPMDLTITNNGEYIYVASFSSDAVVVFNQHDGELTYIQSLVNGTTINDTTITGLGNANALSLSPDEKFLYVASFKDNAVVVFQRNFTDGTLKYLQTYINGDNGIDGISGALTVAAITNKVYVGGAVDDAIAIFQRDVETGLLSYQEVIRFDNSERLDGINSITITEDEKYLFTTSANGNKLSVFKQEEGKLNYKNDNMSASSGVAITNNHVYSLGSNSLTVHKFFPDDGVLNIIETFVDDSVESKEQKVDGLADASDIISSPDGEFIFVTARSDSSITVFKRDIETGKLTFLDIRKDGVDGLNGLSSARSVITNPKTGGNIYVAGFADNSITTFTMAAADLDIEVDEIQTAQLNDTITLGITVTNNGPQQATDVKIETTLPEAARLVSFNPNQGQCSATDKTIHCTLETLEVNDKLTLPIVIAATTIEDMTITTVATSGLYDSSPAKKEIVIPVIAQADLWLDVKTDNISASINTEFQYNITITNNGPDEAFETVLIGELPKSATYKMARVDDTMCDYIKEDHTITCAVGTMKAGISKLATLQIIPLQEDALLDNVMSITTSSFDQDSSNNRVVTNNEVLFNFITTTINNTGENLHNYVIEPNGAIIGGTVSGIILNKGLLSEVAIKPDTIISGGKIAGTIANDGIIENVQLLSNAIVNGGIIRGKIIGFPSAPAMINATIANDTELENVIIGIGTVFNTNIKLGSGVKFVGENIPIGSDLTKTFPKIAGVIDLTANILPEAGSLLEEINSIPDLQPFTQLATGQLFLAMATENMVLIPTSISQVDLPASMTINKDGSVTFITPKGRLVIAQPSLQSPQDLQANMSLFGWDKFVVDDEGAITIDRLVKLRPNLYVQVIDPTLEIGLKKVGSALVLRFLGEDNKRYQQYLYPSAANQTELETTLQAFPGASEVSFSNSGKATVMIGTTIYSAQLDYLIRLGNDTVSATQLLMVSDKNGDGVEDVQMTYSNGDRQVMFFIPPKDTSQPDKPLVESLTALETALQEFGLESFTIAGNGDISIPVTDSLSYVATPALKSEPTWMLLPEGFHYTLTSLPGVLNVALIFKDEAGIKYEQHLYPTAKYPDQLEMFFSNMPGSESVTFNHDGTLLIVNSGLRFKGLFDYAVTVASVPTGSIQVTGVDDLNGDGIGDFEVLYGTGEKQVVYMVPE